MRHARLDGQDRAADGCGAGQGVRRAVPEAGFQRHRDALHSDDPNLRSKLEQMAEMLPSDAPVAITETGASADTDSKTGTSYGLTLLYQFPKTTIQADMKFREGKDALRFQSVTFSPATPLPDWLQKPFFSKEGNGNFFLILAGTVAVLFLVGGGLAVFLLRRPKR
jgi:hypothetical protein